MPVMGLLAVDEPRKLARNDFIRLGLGTGAGAETRHAVFGAPRRRF